MTQREYLLSLRDRANLTQAEAAKKIEIERPYLSKLETEERNISKNLAPRIARAYKEPVENVMRYVQNPRTRKTVLLEQVEALAREVARLGDDQAAIRARLDQFEAELRTPESRRGGEK